MPVRDHRLFPFFVDRKRGFGRWRAFHRGLREDLLLHADGRFVRERLDLGTGRKTVTAGAWALGDRGPGALALALTDADSAAVADEAVEVVGNGFVTGSGPNRVEWFRME
jgi:hypothetical protein